MGLLFNRPSMAPRLDELTGPEPLGPAQMPGSSPPATGLSPVVQDGPLPVISRDITSRIIEVITPVTAIYRAPLPPFIAARSSRLVPSTKDLFVWSEACSVYNLKYISSWWFQIFSNFLPRTLGNDPIWHMFQTTLRHQPLHSCRHLWRSISFQMDQWGVGGMEQAEIWRKPFGKRIQASSLKSS